MPDGSATGSKRPLSPEDQPRPFDSAPCPKHAGPGASPQHIAAVAEAIGRSAPVSRHSVGMNEKVDWRVLAPSILAPQSSLGDPVKHTPLTVGSYPPMATAKRTRTQHAVRGSDPVETDRHRRRPAGAVPCARIDGDVPMIVSTFDQVLVTRGDRALARDDDLVVRLRAAKRDRIRLAAEDLPGRPHDPRRSGDDVERQHRLARGE